MNSLAPSLPGTLDINGSKARAIRYSLLNERGE
jgi:hypothetical protein